MDKVSSGAVQMPMSRGIQIEHAGGLYHVMAGEIAKDCQQMIYCARK